MIGQNGVIGPHEGNELALMLSGKKPLSYFSDEGISDCKPFPEALFKNYVRNGLLVECIFQEQYETEKGRVVVTNYMYALSEEAWRIPALRLVNTVYTAQGAGWRPDLERVIGALLGYAPEDVEAFIQRLRERHCYIDAG